MYSRMVLLFFSAQGYYECIEPTGCWPLQTEQSYARKTSNSNSTSCRAAQDRRDSQHVGRGDRRGGAAHHGAAGAQERADAATANGKAAVHRVWPRILGGAVDR